MAPQWEELSPQIILTQFVHKGGVERVRVEVEHDARMPDEGNPWPRPRQLGAPRDHDGVQVVLVQKTPPDGLHQCPCVEGILVQSASIEPERGAADARAKAIPGFVRQQDGRQHGRNEGELTPRAGVQHGLGVGHDRIQVRHDITAKVSSDEVRVEFGRAFRLRHRPRTPAQRPSSGCPSRKWLRQSATPYCSRPPSPAALPRARRARTVRRGESHGPS
mmetsp:Transcript_11315/g.37460  ORF Transcript_11315/g.37460 Transcript_11315/m.37460 type:complete len:219 (+) Transcript_11315:61-717(+)